MSDNKDWKIHTKSSENFYDLFCSFEGTPSEKCAKQQALLDEETNALVKDIRQHLASSKHTDASITTIFNNIGIVTMKCDESFARELEKLPSAGKAKPIGPGLEIGTPGNWF